MKAKFAKKIYSRVAREKRMETRIMSVRLYLAKG